jgi:hypothetical protein
MLDPRYMDLAAKVMIIFPIGHAQGNGHPPLSLTLGKNSVFIDLATFDVLDPNLLHLLGV